MKGKKRIQALAAAAAVAAALAVPVPAFAEDTVDPAVLGEIGAATMYGDVNLDQNVGLVDAVYLQRYLLGAGCALENWKNADLYEDGEIDVFDLAMLKKELVGEDTGTGASLSIKVVDMVTGEELDDVNISVYGLYEDYFFNVADVDYNSSDDVTIKGLPKGDEYSYLIDLSNLPKGYCGDFGNWDQQYIFSFDGTSDKEVVLRVAPDAAEQNVKISLYDWAIGKSNNNCAIVNITDKEGNPYYPSLHIEDVYLPDGEYHAELRLLDYPLQLLDHDSEYAAQLRELFPDVDFADTSNGIDFTVKDGKLLDEVRFDFAPLEGKQNYIKVHCVDAVTGEPLEGVELSVIEAPESYAKVVAECVSDASGTITVDGLTHSGFPAYMVQVNKMPEGYSGGYDKEVHWGYVYEYVDEFTYSFMPDKMEKNVTASIYKWWLDGDTPQTELWNDATTLEVWSINPDDPLHMDVVCNAVPAGEAFALPDGQYFAALNMRQLGEMGYRSIGFYTKKGKTLMQYFNMDDFRYDTSMTEFTVKDGKPDRDLVFYVKEYVPEEDDEDPSDFDDWDAVERLLNPDAE